MLIGFERWWREYAGKASWRLGGTAKQLSMDAFEAGYKAAQQSVQPTLLESEPILDSDGELIGTRSVENTAKRVTQTVGRALRQRGNMNAQKAVETWEAQDTIDAFQPWELVEIIDALASYFHKQQAAEQKMHPALSACEHGYNGICPTCDASQVVAQHSRR